MKEPAVTAKPPSRHDVIAGVDVCNVSSYRLRGVADKECGVGANVIERDQPVLGRLAGRAFSSSSKWSIPDAARVFTGPGDNALTRISRLPEFERHVANRSFQRRLDGPHDVVMRDRFLRAVIAHRK